MVACGLCLALTCIALVKTLDRFLGDCQSPPEVVLKGYNGLEWADELGEKVSWLLCFCGVCLLKSRGTSFFVF